MSFKALFSRSLGADPMRLHFAAHSHHLWPDASLDGHIAAWNDAARLADRKWDKVMDEVWPEAQAPRRERARQRTIRTAIAFSSNTHDFLVRLVTAAPRTERALRMLTSDGEFHSARRQLARWEEEGWMEVERIATEPFDSFSERFLAAARAGKHDLIFVSQVLFGSGRIFDHVDELAALGRPDGPWVIIDGYHAFMALESRSAQASGEHSLLPRRRLQICDVRRGLRVPSRAARLRTATADHRLVRRVRGFEPAAGQRRLCERRPPLPRRDIRSLGACTGSTRCSECLQRHGLTTARISAHVAALQAANHRRAWQQPH